MPPARRDVRLCRPARNDRRLRQSGAARARRDWVQLDSYWFARSTLPVPGGPIQLVERGPAADALPAHRRAGLGASASTTGQRGYLSIRTNADPERQAHRPHRRRGRRCSACSCPAGACTLPTSPIAQGDLIREVGDDQRSIQNSCSTGWLERLGELQREHRRGREHAVFDRVDGLAADPDPRGELGLGPALGSARSLAGGCRAAQPIAVRPPLADARS